MSDTCQWSVGYRLCARHGGEGQDGRTEGICDRAPGGRAGPVPWSVGSRKPNPEQMARLLDAVKDDAPPSARVVPATVEQVWTVFVESASQWGVARHLSDILAANLEAVVLAITDVDVPDRPGRWRWQVLISMEPGVELVIP